MTTPGSAPEDAAMEDATVEVSVTIASDGAVIANESSSGPVITRWTRQSRTCWTELPASSGPSLRAPKDKQRTYIIPFNMKTKRGAA